MQRKTILISLAVFSLALFGLRGAPSAAKEYHFGTGSWSGSAVYYQKTNQFSGCFVAAPYKSGVLLGFGITRNGNLIISLSHKDWNLQNASVGSVTYYVDSHQLGSYPVKVVGLNQMITDLGRNEWAVTILQHGNMLRAVAPRQTFYFILKGSYDALRKTQECVGIQLALERGTANPFAERNANPFAPRDSNSYTAAPSTHYSGNSPNNNSIWREVIHLAGGNQIKFISLDKSLRDGGFKTAWHTDGTFGYVGQWKADRDISSMMSLVFAYLDGTCKGKYAYGTKEPKYIGRSFIKEGFASCNENGKATTTFATGILNNNIFTFIAHSAREDYQDNAKRINDGVLQVVSAILENSSRKQ